MLNDGKQIAAARQLLGWSQTDLAGYAGISKPSIVRMEADLYSVKHDLRERVQSVLSDNSVEFIEGGTRINRQIVKIIEGDDCYLKLLDQIINEHEGVSEILLSGADEKRCDEQVIEKTRQILNLNIGMRFLIRDGDTHIMGDLPQYRWMDKDLFVDSDVKVMYADKTAYLVTHMGTPRIILIADEFITEENIRLFEFVWKISKKPTHTTADVFY